MQYRRDIDGLRAYAVLLVVLYHFGLPFAGKGFLGVDIFFVISGYLITNIILGDLAKGEFTIVRFYERRIRRIFPALFCIIAFTLYIGAFIFIQPDFRTFAGSAIATVCFVSNIYFYNTINYFDVLADTKLLLHTWSLAVEEQFYILYPILLYAIYRFRKPRLAHILFALTMLSLSADAYCSIHNPRFSFFMFPMRAWQLLFGALAAVLPVITPERGRMTRHLLSASIAIGLLAPIFLWPALQLPEKPGTALLCLAAALALNAQAQHDTLPRRLLSTSPAVGIGLISYSLYLWHWPLYVTFKSYVQVLEAIYGHTTVQIARLVTVALCFAMAFVSWRFVEQPFRRRQLCAGRRAVFIFGLTGMCMLAGAAYYGHTGKLQPVLNTLKAYSYKYTDAEAYIAQANLHREGPFTFMGDAQAAQRVLLAGDSHARHLMPLFIERAQKGDFFAVQAPLVFADTPQSDAEAFVAKYVAPLLTFAKKHNIGNLVLANRWAARFKGFTAFEEQYEAPQVRLMGGGEWDHVEFTELEARLLAAVRAAQDAGLRVWVVTGVPEQEMNVPNFAHKMAFMMLP
ncbi:MAG: acyltransferase, partial [Betaproteobacteria bacterium]|nr:acyltransferase [Betaproteobacteria bacterium]